MARVYRVKAGMTQDELARRAGLTRKTISRLDAGKGTTTLATVRRVAAALGVSLGPLLDGPTSGRAAGWAAPEAHASQRKLTVDNLVAVLIAEFDAIELSDADWDAYLHEADVSAD